MSVEIFGEPRPYRAPLSMRLRGGVAWVTDLRNRPLLYVVTQSGDEFADYRDGTVTRACGWCRMDRGFVALHSRGSLCRVCRRRAKR